MLHTSKIDFLTRQNRANIDLSWLYPALGGTTGSTLNPAFQTDIDDNGDIVDSNGNKVPVDPATGMPMIKGKPISSDQFESNSPYISPTIGQKIFDPQGAAAEQAGNNAWALAGPTAQHNDAIQQGIYGQHYDTMPDYSKPRDAQGNILPASQAAVLGYGRDSNPSLVSQWDRSNSDLAGGIVTPQSQSDITTAGTMLSQAKADQALQPTREATQATDANNILSNARFIQRTQPLVQGTQFNQDLYNNADTSAALNRQPITSATSDASAVNALHEATGVDPMKIQLIKQQLTGELQRDPSDEELRSRVLQTQQAESKVGLGLADTRLNNLGTLQNTEGQNIRLAARDSTYAPLMSNPFYRNADGSMERNPAFMGQLPQMNAKMGINGGNGTAPAITPLTSGFAIIHTPTGDVPAGSPDSTQKLVGGAGGDWSSGASHESASEGNERPPSIGWQPHDELDQEAPGVYDVNNAIKQVLETDGLTPEQKGRKITDLINSSKVYTKGSAYPVKY